MSSRIEEYALIGDCETGALVGRDGSIDWLCLPRFDSDACFAALLGTTDNGRWILSPGQECRAIRRRYRGDSLVLETRYETDCGTVDVIDFMPMRTTAPALVRIVEGVTGRVPMRMQLLLRFGYGRIVPWVQRNGKGIRAIGGPDGVLLQADVDVHGEDLTSVADFMVAPGQRIAFSLKWFESHRDSPEPLDAAQMLHETEQWWSDWVSRSTYRGKWREAVTRSLITLKALTYAPTGGIIAAPTTSLPEKIGGSRNWDYRYCWLRDATMTLFALLSAGYTEESAAWREWLLRAVAGSPSDLQIAYGVRGERRLPELALDWLTGYENSRPVRIGNAACEQFQLDVYGELLDAMFQSRCTGLEPEAAAWNLECALVRFVETAWHLPDEGIWEIRGPRQHFTHSKVMAWVAIDRAVKSIKRFGLEGPLDEWQRLRTKIHDDVCSQGYSDRLNSFVQVYGSEELDAALLMIPLVGFLSADDPRVRGTVHAIERELLDEGFLRRYATSNRVDGLPPGEGVFLPCTFWLADNYVLTGRIGEAQEVFERLLELRNDVGLLAEQYDPHNARLSGNFPQALSHIALINTATNLSRTDGAAKLRSRN
jgi:GH15 family glucan-1,4-alpha-glucosidase